MTVWCAAPQCGNACEEGPRPRYCSPLCEQRSWIHDVETELKAMQGDDRDHGWVRQAEHVASALLVRLDDMRRRGIL
jgi:hypothetical protein